MPKRLRLLLLLLSLPMLLPGCSRCCRAAPAICRHHRAIQLRDWPGLLLRLEMQRQRLLLPLLLKVLVLAAVVRSLVARLLLTNARVRHRRLTRPPILLPVPPPLLLLLLLLLLLPLLCRVRLWLLGSPLQLHGADGSLRDLRHRQPLLLQLQPLTSRRSWRTCRCALQTGRPLLD